VEAGAGLLDAAIAIGGRGGRGETYLPITKLKVWLQRYEM
jgi:hypothetical protein